MEICHLWIMCSVCLPFSRPMSEKWIPTFLTTCHTSPCSPCFINQGPQFHDGYWFSWGQFFLKLTQKVKSQRSYMSTLLHSVHIHCEQYNCGKSLLGQKTMFSVCGVKPSCKNHWVFNGKPVAISWDIKLMHHALIVPAIHSLKKTGPITPLVQTAMPTVTLIEGSIFLVSICIFLGTQDHTLCSFSKPSKWKCVSSENHTLCTVISSCSAHTANCSLC